jgi:hypothetical protein
MCEQTSFAYFKCIEYKLKTFDLNISIYTRHFYIELRKQMVSNDGKEFFFKRTQYLIIYSTDYLIKEVLFSARFIQIHMSLKYPPKNFNFMTADRDKTRAGLRDIIFHRAGVSSVQSEGRIF